MITKAMAEAAKHGDQFYTVWSAKGESVAAIVRVRVTGKCRTWKTHPTWFRLPVKHGLRESFYITHENAAQWSISPSAAVLESAYSATIGAPFGW